MPGYKPPAAPKQVKKPAPPKAKPLKAPKKPKGAEGIDIGDSVYVRHPKQGAVAVTVTSRGGEHGFVARDDAKQRHEVPWDQYLGHRARMLNRYELIEQGVDGALVRDSTGRQRFLAGMEMPEPETKLAAENAKTNDDPIVGGLDRLAKAESAPMTFPAFPDGVRVLLVKGGPVANRPGLSLQTVTDRKGHQTRRWERNGPEQQGQGRQPAAGGPAPIQHNQTIRFRHGNVEGHGKVVDSGRSGVLVETAKGKPPTPVYHEHIEGRAPERPDYPERAQGEDDKGYAKRVKDSLPDPDHLPEDHARYFNDHPDAQHVPLEQLHSTKGDAENEQGGRNGAKLMAAAYHGVVGKRDPITVKKRADGSGFDVADGNGTLTAAKKHGWKTLPVREDAAGAAPSGPGAADQADDPGQNPQPLFKPEETAHLPAKVPQPFKDQASLYEASAPALDYLKKWLNMGSGICSQMGHKTMPGGTEGVDFTEPGGMLFIAPLKGEKRAKEKVELDYGGDWSQLKDTVRCSVAVDTHEELGGVLEKLKAGGLKLAQQPKDRFAKPVPVGYRDMLMNVTFPNGVVGELQLHVKPMLAAKVAGHKHYETERVLTETAKTRDLTDEEKSTLATAQAEQKRIYSEAWRAATSGASKSPETPMAKALRAPKGKAMGAKGKGGGFEYFEHDGAMFRRNTAKAPELRAVDDVLHGQSWTPYGGDALKPALFGNPVADPMTGGDGGGGQPQPQPAGGGKPMRKALPVVFL